MQQESIDMESNMTGVPHDLALTRWSGWVDRIFGWRDALLASRIFQRRVAAFALTRPVARRRARELFDLVAGFVYSQVLLACVQLRLFEILREGPQSCERLASRLEMQPDEARRLLDAAVSLRLVEHRSNGRYGLGELGAPMVGNTAVAAMVQHHAALYSDLADPVSLLRSSKDERRESALSRYWAYDEASTHSQTGAPGAANRVGAYTTLMAESQPLVADEILDAYALRRHHCLLDVGGGDGRFLATVADRVPALRLMLFELPAVAERARTRFDAARIGGRASVFDGDFLTDALPTGADIASLVRVIHDHHDANAMTILRAVHAALPPGGTLLLAEPMSCTPGAEAMGDGYFGFYLLAMGRGRPRRANELIQMLNAAGFDAVRRVATRMPLQTQLLVAQRARVNPV
jgi:demethylspheroidene O-methyltransferase